MSVLQPTNTVIIKTPTTLLGVAEFEELKTSLQIITIDKGSRHQRKK
jgi:hypothetical protein